MTETSRSEIKNILQKLDEKFLNKEIDETIYNELKAKYEKQLKEKTTDAEKLLAEYKPPKTPSAIKVEEPKKSEKIGTGKKIAIAVLALFLLVIIASYFWFQGEKEQREAMQNVEVSLTDVQLRGIGLTSASVDIYVNMYNPDRRITATLDRFDYNLYVNGNYLGNGYISQRVDIPPLSTQRVSGTLQVSYSGVGSAVWSVLTSGRQSWRIIGTFYFKTPIGTISIPIDNQR